MSFTQRTYQTALRQVKSKGAAVTFTLPGDTSYDETSEDPTGGSSTLQGFAVELPGDPEEYAAMELIQASPVTLMFVPLTVGPLPTLGSTVQWAGSRRTVRAVMPFRPQEAGVAARLVLT